MTVFLNWHGYCSISRVSGNQGKGVESLLSSIGVPGLILILVVTLLLFGPSRLPELGRSVGTTLKEFKQATQELTDEEKNK